jgi:hypothetical protein
MERVDPASLLDHFLDQGFRIGRFRTERSRWAKRDTGQGKRDDFRGMTTHVYRSWVPPEEPQPLGSPPQNFHL